MTKEKVVFTRRIAQQLIRQGFKVIRVEPNPKKPELDCYIFAETPEFKTAFANIANR